MAGSIAIAVLAFATEGIFALLQYLVTPRGLRKRSEKRLVDPSITPATNSPGRTP